MSNVTVTTSTSNVNVNSTTNEVNVTSTSSNIVVGATAVTPASTIRESISVTDTGGDGSLSYSNVSGVITYTGPSASEVRAHLSNTSPILYDTSTGVISLDSSAVLQSTFVDLGNKSGNVAIDSSLGDNFRLDLTGDLTGFDFSSVNNGDSFTILIVQDGIGGHQIDTTTHSAFWNDVKFANDFKTLDTNPNNWNIISIVYDGSGPNIFYASLVVEEALGITNNDLANSNVIVNGTTIELGSSGNIANFGTLDTDDLSEGSTNQYYTDAKADARVNLQTGTNLDLSSKTTSELSEGTNQYYTDARSRAAVSVTQASASGDGTLSYNNGTGVLTYTPPDLTAFGLTNAQVLAHIATVPLAVGGNLSVTGNIDATGNINYQNVTDLYVTDQKITLNANATTDATVEVISFRPQAGADTKLRWNETTDIWEFTNDGSTFYPIPTSTTDLAEGTNLYYTDARFDTRLGTKDTDNLSEGSTNLYFTNARANTVIGTNTTDNITEGSTNLYFTNARANTVIGTNTTDNITEGSTNLYYTDARSRGAVSVTQASASGAGTLAYNNSTGVFTYTPPDLSTFSTLTNAQAQAFIQTNGLAMTNTITSNSLISTTGNVQINPDTEIDGMKGLTYDSTNNFLGLGTTTPEAAFHQISDNNGFSATVLLTEYSTGSTAGDFRFQRGEGTLANPSVMNSGDRIGQIRWEPIFSKAAGNISYGTDYNTTIEMSGFSDGTQGGTTTITDISLIGSRSGSTDTHSVQDVQAFDNGTLTVDSITFAGGQIFSDGVVIDFSGATDPNVTPLNGLSFYVKYNAGDGGRYELFDDAAYSTGSNRVTGSGFYSSGVGQVGVKADRLEFTDRTLNFSDGRIFTFSGATDSNVTPLNGQVAYVDRVGGSTSRRYELYKDASRIDPWNLQGTLNVTGLQVETSDFYQPTGLQVQINNTQESQTSLTKIRANGTMEFGATSFQAGTGAAASITKDGIFTTQGNITSSGNVSGNYFIGDGSLLTNITSTLPANITVDQINFPVASTGATKPNIATTHDNAYAIDISGVNHIRAVDRTGGFEYDDLVMVYGPNKRFQVNQSVNGNPTNEVNYLTLETDGTLYVKEGNITASSTENITLDSGTKNVVISKTLAGTKYDQLTFNNQGWAPTSYKTNPAYNGSAERVAYVVEGTTTAGSNILTVTTAAEFQDAYGTSTFNGNAPTAGGRTAMFTGTNAIATNYIGRARGTLTSGCFPFPPGVRISSIDTVNFTITMDRPAEETATLSWNGGGSDTDVFLIAAGAYGYSSTEGYSETYFSSYDFQQLGSGSTSKVTLFYSEISNQDAYGFGKTGPSWSGTNDIGVSIGTTSDYTAPTYDTRGRVALEGETTFINSNYGFTAGANASLSNRINNDRFTGFGYNQLWDGTEDYNTDFGFTGAIPQIGTKQYTDGSLQATNPYIGTRIQFNSAYGQITDNPNQWYPRTGQELGRMGWWGSHGNLENPSSLAAPAYISVQAADDWTNGSNASMYFVATSDYSQTYREPFISYEKGNLILASGNVGGVTQNITFAPAKRAQGSGANPAGTYDFVGGASSTAAFGTMNYANTSANSGAEFSVNNGGSLGAGTVGDMKISIHRKDNSYTANVSATPTGFFTAASGGVGTDIIYTSTGVVEGTGNAYTFSGITDANWTFLNGNTYAFSNYVAGAQYKEIRNLDGSAVTQGGSDTAISAGSYEYVSSQASGVTDKEWNLTLAEQSEDLNLETGIGGAITQIIPHKNQGSSPWTGLADSIAISGLSGTAYNGTLVSIAGITDSGATEANGNSYYIKWDSAQTVYGLYTDIGLLTPVQVMTSSSFIGSPGGTPTATYNGSTVTFTDNRTQFNTPVDLKSYSTTEINALASPQEGDTVYNNTLHQLCFYNGTAWQKVTSANM